MKEHNHYKCVCFKENMELVGCIGDDKASWGQISALINRGEWEKIILIVPESMKELPSFDKAIILKINFSLPIKEVKEDIKKKLKDEIGNSFEVALSLASGNGKEHMAVLSAILDIPAGVRITAFTKNGIEFLS